MPPASLFERLSVARCDLFGQYFRGSMLSVMIDPVADPVVGVWPAVLASGVPFGPDLAAEPGYKSAAECCRLKHDGVPAEL